MRQKRLSLLQFLKFEILWAHDPRDAVERTAPILFDDKEITRIRDTYRFSKSPGIADGMRDAILHPKKWFIKKFTWKEQLERQLAGKRTRTGDPIQDLLAMVSETEPPTKFCGVDIAKVEVDETGLFHIVPEKKVENGR